jgi:hypothetical protein
LQRDEKQTQLFASQRADNMNLLEAVKGDFLNPAFEKPKRCRTSVHVSHRRGSLSLCVHANWLMFIDQNRTG